MSILGSDLINQELPFEAMPDACLLQRMDIHDLHHKPHHALASMDLWVAKGAELAGLQIVIWPCEWSEPHGNYPAGYIMNTSLIEPPFDPRWGDCFPKEDFFSSYQHMEEIIERHTFGMLNIARLKELNRIWNQLKS